MKSIYFNGKCFATFFLFCFFFLSVINAQIKVDTMKRLLSLASGGETWEKQYFPNQAALNDIIFIDHYTDFAVGEQEK
jgi:hypothetical protein